MEISKWCIRYFNDGTKSDMMYDFRIAALDFVIQFCSGILLIHDRLRRRKDCSIIYTQIHLFLGGGGGLMIARTIFASIHYGYCLLN